MPHQVGAQRPEVRGELDEHLAVRAQHLEHREHLALARLAGPTAHYPRDL